MFSQLMTRGVTNKRLVNEITQLMSQQKYQDMGVEFIHNNNKTENINTETDILVRLSPRHTTDTYTFTISINYPFVQPSLTINTIPHQAWVRLPSLRFKKMLKCVSGLECLCCHSYLCQGNWSPAITLHHVITQMQDYKTFKYLIIVKLLLNQIREKYLNNDIELDSWLFHVYYKM